MNPTAATATESQPNDARPTAPNPMPVPPTEPDEPYEWEEQAYSD